MSYTRLSFISLEWLHTQRAYVPNKLFSSTADDAGGRRILLLKGQICGSQFLCRFVVENKSWTRQLPTERSFFLWKKIYLSCVKYCYTKNTDHCGSIFLWVFCSSFESSRTGHSAFSKVRAICLCYLLDIKVQKTCKATVELEINWLIPCTVILFKTADWTFSYPEELGKWLVFKVKAELLRSKINYQEKIRLKNLNLEMLVSQKKINTCR